MVSECTKIGMLGAAFLRLGRYSAQVVDVLDNHAFRKLTRQLSNKHRLQSPRRRDPLV